MAALVVLGGHRPGLRGRRAAPPIPQGPGQPRALHPTRGCGRYSRHPNYLGEITTWWGLWLFALAASPRWWWTVAGAAAITLMFVFVSVPMMEKRALATRAGYREYRERTPMLLPGLDARGSVPDAK